MLIAFNKPFGTVCRFTPEPGRRTLADFIDLPGVYPAGRLDADSEGLLLLTNDGPLQARISEPRHKLPKVYLAQVEGIPTEEALENLRRGAVRYLGSGEQALNTIYVKNLVEAALLAYNGGPSYARRVLRNPEARKRLVAEYPRDVTQEWRRLRLRQAEVEARRTLPAADRALAAEQTVSTAQ